MGLGESFRAHGAGVACLRQFETVERSGMEGPAGGAGHWRRWNGKGSVPSIATFWLTGQVVAGSAASSL